MTREAPRQPKGQRSPGRSQVAPAPDRGPAGNALPEKTLTQDCCVTVRVRFGYHKGQGTEQGPLSILSLKEDVAVVTVTT